MQDCFLSSCQPEQEAPDQGGGRGGGQPPLRPHRTAGRLAARRCSAGTGSGSRRGAASVARPDRGAWRGWAGAAAVAGAAAAAPTSSSGHARRTRKPPAPSTWSPESARAARRLCSRSCAGRAPGGGTGRGSSLLPDLDAAGSPGRPGSVSRPSFSWKSPSAALRPSDDPGARSLNSSAHQQVLAPRTRISPVSSFSKITATTLSKPPRLSPPYWSLFPLLIAHYPHSSPREGFLKILTTFRTKSKLSPTKFA